MASLTSAVRSYAPTRRTAAPTVPDTPGKEPVITRIELVPGSVSPVLNYLDGGRGPSDGGGSGGGGGGDGGVNIPKSLADLDDVEINGVSDGDVIVSQQVGASYKWYPKNFLKTVMDYVVDTVTRPFLRSTIDTFVDYVCIRIEYPENKTYRYPLGFRVVSYDILLKAMQTGPGTVQPSWEDSTGANGVLLVAVSGKDTTSRGAVVNLRVRRPFE